MKLKAGCYVPFAERLREEYKINGDQMTANIGTDKIESLMQDAGIVRNRLKIQSAVGNAARFLEVQREFGSFDAYLALYLPPFLPKRQSAR